MTLTSVPTPTGLDDSPRLLFWTFEAVYCFSIPLVLSATLFDRPVVGGLLGVVAGGLFERYVKRLSTLVRWSHWVFGVAPFRRIPASEKRFFIG